MQINKNENLTLVITGISYLYTNVPIDIVSWPDRFHKCIYLPEGDSFKEIYFTPGTAEFEEIEKEADPGMLFDQSLKCIIPGEDDDTASLLDAIRNHPLIIKITFDNDKKKLIGLAENPARFGRSQKLSAKASSAQISFTCSSNEGAWWIYYEGPDNR